MRALLFVVALLVGISTATLPLSGATAPALPQNPEPEEQGMDAAAGVHVTVKADSWTGWPAELTQVIPLLVTIENRSSTPIRLRYQEFSLVPPSGRQRAALPPFEIGAREPVPVGTAGVIATPYPYTVSGFLVAPHLAPYYPAFDPFVGTFAYDPFFYSTYYPAFRSIPLPTQDMVAKALPEGVLGVGGAITGFVYFRGDEIPSEQATFHMDIVNAQSGRTLGTALVPLEID